MRGFHTELLDYLKRTYPSSAEVALRLTADINDPDLESLIERVEIAAATGAGLQFLASAKTQDVEKELEEIAALRSYIRAFIVDRCERFNETLASSELLPLFQLSQHARVTIFTTNYDRIVEHCAQNSGFTCSDGFDHTEEPVATWAKSFEGNLRIVKLHGSVNWFQDGDSVVRLDRGFSLPSHEFELQRRGRPLTSLMVIPTLQKETLGPPYAELRMLFGDAIRACRFLVVAGSSLRDAHLTSVIAARLEDERAVVLIIDPAIPVGIQDLPRKDLVVHASVTFHDFLSVSIHELTPLAEEIAAASTIQEAAQVLEHFAQRTRESVQAISSLTLAMKTALLEVTTGSSFQKISALPALEGTTNAAVIGAVSSALADDDADVRAAAASVAAQLDFAKAVPILERNVTSARDSRDKLEAILALKQMTVPEAGEALERIKQRGGGADPLTNSVLS